MKRIVIGMAILLVVVLLVLNLANRTPYRSEPFRRAIFLSGPSKPNFMEKSNPHGLIKGSALISVRPIHSGNLRVPLSNPVNLKDPACSGMKDKDLVVPVFAYLIHHDKYGYYLIDSGFDASYHKNTYGRLKGLIVPKVVPKTDVVPKEEIEKQIASIRGKLQGVFFTHLHPDHTAGLPVLPKNLPLVAGQGEQLPSVPWIFEPNHFKDGDVVYMIDFDTDDAVKTPLGKAVDIFGDQTLWAISTPGHTKGHVSYLVNTKKHPVLIAGDAVTRNQCMEIGVGPGTCCEDVKLAGRTFERINAFVKKHPEVKVWAGHDFPK
jgi:glyoxylase-like metal-dependent hydrolase (beta-lactamase superfamily II)